MPDIPSSKPDARDSKGVNPALSLYQLIGAPLHAIVDAESQAAMATRDFIRDVGFTGKDSTGSGDEEYGDLRMVNFQVNQNAADGPSSTAIGVPLLSMLPIPALQVKEAEIDFHIKVVETTTHRSTPTRSQIERGIVPAASTKEGPDLTERLDIRAAITRNPAGASRSSMEMQMHIKIRIEQADVPAGMARFFNLLDQSITSKALPPSTEES